MKTQNLGRVVLSCAIAIASSTAIAQEALDEVTVTATRRAESIQDVPVSVVAMSAETMNDLGVINVADISAYVPNMEFVSNGVRSNFYMRGIGSGPTHSIEQSVGRFVDDVYIGRADANLHGFLDLAGIEVLRGPQGTLFGKNTAAGAVIVTTADPTDEFTAGVKAKYGFYSTVNDYQDIEGFVSGSLTDTVRARLALRLRDDGGFVDNLLPGPDSSERQDILTRLKLEWDAGSNTTIKFKGEFARFEMDGQAIGEINGVPSAFPLSGPPLAAISPDLLEVDWVNGIDCESETVYTTPPPGTPLPSPPFPPGAVFEDITGLPGGTSVNSGTFCPGRIQDTSTVALTIDHDLESGGTLRFITALQNYDWEHKFNSIDQGAGTSFRAIRAEDYQGLSAEVRFTSEARDNFDYIVGAYYESSELERYQRSNFNFVSFFGAPLPFLTRNEPWNQDTDTIAAYGQFRWSLSDQLSATVGARYSDESKDYNFQRFCNPYQTNDPFAPNGLFGGQCPAFFNFDAVRSESRSESDFSPSIGFEWQATDDLMVFFNASEGYKSGGFSDRVESQTGRIDYDPESNTTYELGFKGTFRDGAMNANLTIFHMDIEDMQLASATASLGFEVTNAGAATSQGIEFEMD
ncbi:MAG: TonB-dependent receptor, partial [Gammaproteobacteria bacterium]|nr:TonB-dependent receptor [Gammaproteobacteria bacterium]NNL49816.1 TonB-dependent receptor [Woeseiaceae bacterium]